MLADAVVDWEAPASLPLHSQDAHFFATTVFQSGHLKGDQYMFYAPDTW